jgi:tRNA nucleotidyltransferase/poly(A) polymerase
MNLQDKIPKDAKDIMQKLVDNKFQVYAIGGFVRDNLLGLNPHDIDLFTNATGDEILNLFPSGKILGGEIRQEKILTVMVGDVEVSQFRSNGKRTETGFNLEDHQSTCDLTINSMACDIGGNIIDSEGGQEDLNSKTLRFVGSPLCRINEDPLRVLRAVRFLAKYGLTADQETYKVLLNGWGYINGLPKERLREEFLKILKEEEGLGILLQLRIGPMMIPELIKVVGMEGGQHHNEDVLTHMLTAYVVAKSISDDWRVWLAAFFHDIGKGSTKTEEDDGTHFYRHEYVGGKYVEEWMTEYKFSNADIKFVSTLVKMHMWGYKENLNRKTFVKKVNELQDAGCSIYDFLMICYCDHQANMAKEDIKFGDFVKNSYFLANYLEMMTNNMPFKTTDLKVNGRDMMKFGYEGRQIGEVLQYLMDQVLEGNIINRADVLVQSAKASPIPRKNEIKISHYAHNPEDEPCLPSTVKLKLDVRCPHCHLGHIINTNMKEYKEWYGSFSCDCKKEFFITGIDTDKLKVSLRKS